MATCIRITILLLAVTACGYSRPSNVGSIGGQVRGLWNGADGVTLRLQAEGIDAALVVPTNGLFKFPEQIAEGTLYTIVVAASAAHHTCVVDTGGNGTFPDADVMNVSIACTGPSLTVALSGPWGWTFDPTQEVQTFAGSIATQDVALTITGASLTSASVAGSTVILGQETESIALPLGPLMVPVALIADGGLSKTYELVFDRGDRMFEQVVYGKASNTGMSDAFGSSVAVFGDTVAVGTIFEASSAIGINGNEADNSARESGAVYVFARSGTTWTQQAYIKASNTGMSDEFGFSVALSDDTLAVGAPFEASNSIGINVGNQADNSAFGAGAVYVFVRGGTRWTQQAYVKASNTEPPLPGEIVGDAFGSSVSLSGDTLAVGAPGEDSDASGVNRDQTNNNAPGSGAVYVFVRNGQTWTQQAYIKASNTSTGDNFGAVSLSDDTLAVGAPGESSKATGVNGDQADKSALNSGAVYVFVRNDTTWSQQAYVKASNTRALSEFGSPIALSGDTLAVAAIGESSNATGIDGNQVDTSATSAGAAYVFARRNLGWAQQAYIKASNTAKFDNFGSSLSLSGDTLAVGAPNENGSATGINGVQDDNNAFNGAGAVYVFNRDGMGWSQRLYVKASSAVSGGFGRSAAISGDTLVVGAPHEPSGSTGINPANGQADHSVTDAGAIYIFR
jgi:hypothetical protein